MVILVCNRAHFKTMNTKLSAKGRCVLKLLKENRSRCRWITSRDLWSLRNRRLVSLAGDDPGSTYRAREASSTQTIHTTFFYPSIGLKPVTCCTYHVTLSQVLLALAATTAPHTQLIRTLSTQLPFTLYLFHSADFNAIGS